MWRLTGNMNFQFYWIDQDWAGLESDSWPYGWWWSGVTSASDATAAGPQEHDWYFGVDEAELRLDVSGTADNGLNYGFRIEINANTTDGADGIADEARIELSGSWGTLLLGDDDGAENVMNYGGENLMGAAGGFDGDSDDYMFRAGWTSFGVVTFEPGAQGFPMIAGDSGDATKISYFSPRFSGFQIGASFAPAPNDGDGFKADGDWENHYGIGANYDKPFGNLRVRASAVYSATTSNQSLPFNIYGYGTRIEDVSAWSVGAIVGWGPFSIGGNYTDNGESGYWTASGAETSYWNAAIAFESGRFSLAAGYFESTIDWPADWAVESTYTHTSLTADYSAAPGLGFYAEVDFIEDDMYSGQTVNQATAVIAGAKVSF
jgi:hypothetical protein